MTQKDAFKFRDTPLPNFKSCKDLKLAALRANFAIAKFGLISIAVLSGCATVPKASLPAYPERKSVLKKGIYHKVKKGETLWRISKLYDVDLEKIVRANNLTDATKIVSGQLLFIPDISNAKPKTNIPDDGSEKNGFIWPLKGKVVYSFGINKPDHTINKGIDILTKDTTAVLAVKTGKVIFCSENIKGFGKTIIIDHEDGFFSLYANNAEIIVSQGQSIRQGELIAHVGKIERTGDHILHFEIRKGHVPQNPFYFLP